MKKKEISISEGNTLSVVKHGQDLEKWIFLCHGFGSNKDRSNRQRAEFFAEKGWNAVRFDFRGNGESSGDFIEQDLSSRVEDLLSVIDHFDPERCVVFGSSFGGKVALHTAVRDDRIKAIIGKAPAIYNDTMERFRAAIEEKGTFEYIEGKPIDERFLKDLDSYTFDKVIDSLDCPVLVFHGSEDTTVHPERSFQALQELDVDSSLYKFRGEKHRFSDDGERRMLRIAAAWMKEYTG